MIRAEWAFCGICLGLALAAALSGEFGGPSTGPPAGNRISFQELPAVLHPIPPVPDSEKESQRKLFEPRAEAIELPPIQLPIPSVPLNVPLAFPPAYAYLLDAPRGRPEAYTLGLDMDDLNETIRRLDKTIQAGDADGGAHLQMGLALSRLDLWESARTHFQIAAKKERLKGSALCYAGETFAKTGQYEIAEDRFREAGRFGARAQALNGLGLLALLRDQPERAREHLELAAETGLLEAQINLAAIRLHTGASQAAVVGLQDALHAGRNEDQKPRGVDSRLIGYFVAALVVEERLQEARNVLKRETTKQPALGPKGFGFFTERFLRAYIDLADDRRAVVRKAVEDFGRLQKAAEEEPVSSRYRSTLAFLRGYGNLKLTGLAADPAAGAALLIEAESDFRRAARGGYPPEAALAGAARSALGQQGSHRAIQYLAVAVRQAEEALALRKKLIELYLRTGASNDAAAEIHRLLTRQPDDPFGQSAQAIVAYRRRDMDTALALLDAMLETTGRPIPVYVTDLRWRIWKHRFRSRLLYTFDHPPTERTWAWRVSDTPTTQGWAAHQSKAFHLGDQGGNAPGEVSMTRSIRDSRFLSLSADLNTIEGANAEVGMAITGAKTQTEPAQIAGEVALYKRRSESGEAQVVYRLLVPGGEEETGVVAPWPEDGFHRLTVEWTEKGTFAFAVDAGTPVETFGTMARDVEVSVRLFGRAPGGQAWHAAVDNVELLIEKGAGDG